jgi:hypothetical protein
MSVGASVLTRSDMHGAVDDHMKTQNEIHQTFYQYE